MTIDKWQKLSFVEQVGNIGSEISRARHWETLGDWDIREKSLERALELIDLTLTDKRWQSRLKELTRFREVLCDLIIGARIYDISLKNLEDFCLNFALLARKNNLKSG